MTDLPKFDYTDADRRRWLEENDLALDAQLRDIFATHDHIPYQERAAAFAERNADYARRQDEAEAGPDEVDRSMAVVAMVICGASGAVVGLIVGIPLGAMLAQNVARWWHLI